LSGDAELRRSTVPIFCIIPATRRRSAFACPLLATTRAAAAPLLPARRSICVTTPCRRQPLLARQARACLLLEVQRDGAAAASRRAALVAIA